MHQQDLARPGLGLPIATPPERCARPAGVDLATIQEAAATSTLHRRRRHQELGLMLLERQLPGEADRWRQGGYLDRR